MTHADRIASAAADAAASSAAKATYAGGALSAVGGVALSSEAIALVGLALALAGWLTQVYFGLRRDRRDAELHALDVKARRRRMEGEHS